MIVYQGIDRFTQDLAQIERSFGQQFGKDAIKMKSYGAHKVDRQFTVSLVFDHMAIEESGKGLPYQLAHKRVIIMVGDDLGERCQVYIGVGSLVDAVDHPFFSLWEMGVQAIP
jgi:hypothetical protein